MKLFLNEAGEIDVAEINNKSTVQDFFDAVEEYLAKNPLPCQTCGDEHCCKRFKIYADSVSAKKLSKGYFGRVIPKMKVEMKPQGSLDIFFSVGKCRYLDKNNRCSIYNSRPATCRSYICTPNQSDRYKIIDSSIVAELHHAMRLELLKVTQQDPKIPYDVRMDTKASFEKSKETSVVFGKYDYGNILIKDCVKNDLKMSNASPEEVNIMNEILSEIG